ncbi:ABC transporter permease [Tuberibacillus sp. Marseille-P3662]|uniref:ABC transporter permease n=1 Tax=Tuberibacillus sp. Marseille-P3662 TaxID=1965358 RepID=UPI000A1CBEDE|nr:ABC transporter permease [Tuberibacillus sp. Marseille-P3662]
MMLDYLFTQRRKQDAREKWHLIKSMLDWTYVFYGLLPLTALFIYGYIRTLRQQPVWMADIPISVIHTIIMIFIVANALRTYIKPADQLFLVRRYQAMATLVKHGIRRLLVVEIIRMLLVAAVIFPYLFNHYSYINLFVYSFMLLAFNVFFTLYLYSPWRNKWLTTCLLILYILSGFLQEFWLFAGIASFGLAVYLYKIIRYNQQPFIQWLALEQKKGSRLLGAMYRAATISMSRSGIEKEYQYSIIDRFIQYRLPLKRRLFSTRTQNWVLLESFIKWFYRRPHYWFYFPGVFVVNALSLYVGVTWVVAIVSVVCYFVMLSILSYLWRRFFDHPFMKIYRWEQASVDHAKSMTQTVLFGIFAVFFVGLMLLQDGSVF